MNGITSMQRSSTSYADYGKFASGKKVNRAADGAAELAIIQKQETQTRSYKVGENNIGAAKDMLNVADGAMSGITDYLQKIRELGVRASNTVTITDAERTSIQAQIEQYKQGISDIVKQASFNTKPLLDGTSQKYNIMTDATGNGMEITTADATLQALGIADFDVTKDFDLTQVDDALARVSAGRSGMGAQSNALEYAYRYSTNTRLNVTAGKSRLEDLDYGQAMPNERMIRIINKLHDWGNRIVLFTARGYVTGIDWKPVTEKQMQDWGVQYDELHMGKPNADYYVDDKMLDLEFLYREFEKEE